MRSRFKLLSLTVGATVVMLAASALLVVLGIFDEHLDWDLFSPEAEKVLYGLFFTCLALGGFGAAISIVLGVQEVVKSLRRMIDSAHPAAAEPVREVSRRGYFAVVAALFILLAATVVAFNAANRRVEAKRLATFKLIVRDEMRQLGPHLEGEMAKIPAPCATCGTLTLWELHQTQMNSAPAFNWYQVIKDGRGKVHAVLKIYGDPSESYRDYQAVAQAAQARGT